MPVLKSDQIVSAITSYLDQKFVTKDDLSPILKTLEHHEKVLFRGNGQPPIMSDLAVMKNEIQHTNEKLDQILAFLDTLQQKDSPEAPGEAEGKTSKKDVIDYWKWTAVTLGGFLVALLGWIAQKFLTLLK